MNVVGYIRVSTAEQADSGAGLDAQRAAIALEAERRGWQLARGVRGCGSLGKSLSGRRGLQEALAGRRERRGRGARRREARQALALAARLRRR